MTLNPQTIEEMIATQLTPDEFVVKVSVSPSMDIRVVVDSLSGMSISRCIALSKWLTAQIDSEENNYSLEVSSAGLGEPFEHPKQYVKNVGKPITIVLQDGSDINGMLVSAEPESCTVMVTKVIAAHTDANGKKHKKQIVEEEVAVKMSDIKYAKYRFE